MTIEIRSMGYARVASTDLEQWKQFGTKVLGLAEGRGPNADNLYFRIDEVSARLVVFPSDRDELSCVGWELADHPALQDAREHLAKAGVEFEEGSPDELAERRVQAGALEALVERAPRQAGALQHELTRSDRRLEADPQLPDLRRRRRRGHRPVLRRRRRRGRLRRGPLRRHTGPTPRHRRGRGRRGWRAGPGGGERRLRGAGTRPARRRRAPARAPGSGSCGGRRSRGCRVASSPRLRPAPASRPRRGRAP